MEEMAKTTAEYVDVVRMRDCVPQLSLSEGLQFLYGKLPRRSARSPRAFSRRAAGRATEAKRARSQRAPA